MFHVEQTEKLCHQILLGARTSVVVWEIPLGSMATTAALRLAFHHCMTPQRAKCRTALLLNRCRARDRVSI
jgi:hypothetical protein